MAAYVIVNTTNSGPNYTTSRDATGGERSDFLGMRQQLPPRAQTPSVTAAARNEADARGTHANRDGNRRN
ncbi:hypothetical protein EUA06_21920 [Nocardioides glacieisoli]|uniref:Uncharacterized protein n=1 Tax=Nocardioides glacieisoli TaxID=1168730 RepID=A0A4Q2RJ36_9ACTN|nr:hypothetical protein [Nocardioides glacieisoli]RYB88308.1 hypothetical protein EUA06_21920 [Nocardioides glacieisoli]